MKSYLVRSAPLCNTGVQAPAKPEPFTRAHGANPREAAANWLSLRPNANRFGPTPTRFYVTVGEDIPGNVSAAGEPHSREHFCMYRPGIEH